MWQFYSFASVFCEALEETIDKATMIGQKSIDILSATWIRNFIFLLITFVAALLLNKEIVVNFSKPVILLGILYGISAIFYSNLLKQIEITASGVLEKFFPIIFLPIDIFIVGSGFLSRQILGILFLVTGGLVFYVAQKNSNFTRKQFYLMITVFTFDAILFGFESYLFKDLYKTMNLSVSNFLLSEWTVAIIFLTIILLIKFSIYRRPNRNIATIVKYSGGSFLAKVADFGNSFFLLKALITASTSQVSAMSAFYPIVLVLVALLTQKRFKLNLEENTDNSILKNKLLGAVIISIGAVLVR